MTRLEWTDPAVEDLQGIVDYIARDSPLYADVVAERIVFAVERLATFPRSGRIVPEADDPRVREIIVQSYRVMYRIKQRKVQILAVVHTARDLARMKPKPWDAT